MLDGCHLSEMALWANKRLRLSRRRLTGPGVSTDVIAAPEPRKHSKQPAVIRHLRIKRIEYLSS